MGCDIHMKVERRVNGKWEQVEKLPARACSYCERGRVGKDRERDCFICDGTAIDPRPYHDRNYTVFAVLANVRNDGYVTPISEPKGLPAGYKNKDYDYGDHSFSYLTLAELRAYDWKQVIKDEGFLSADQFKEWEAKGRVGAPSGWCGGVSGASIEHVTNSRMREFIEAGMREHPLIEGIAGRRSFYTLCQWSIPLTSYCKFFLSFIETISSLGEPEDVRIVFGFDS